MDKNISPFFRNENWNIGKDIFSFLFLLATISFTIWLINIVRGIFLPTFSSYYLMLMNVTAVGILPYLMVLFIRHNYFVKMRLRKATMMNIDLFLNEEPVRDSISDNININKHIEPVDVNNFISAEAKDDYVVVKIARNDGVKELIIGNTLSEFEDGNAHFDQLFKCNDSSIVNMDRVLWVEGNAAGYKLALHPKLPSIAVSNDKQAEFIKFMEVVQ